MSNMIFVSSHAQGHFVNSAIRGMSAPHYNRMCNFKVAVSKSPTKLGIKEDEHPAFLPLPATPPTLFKDFHNPWAGSTIEEIEKWCLQARISTFLVLDTETFGFDTPGSAAVVLASRKYLCNVPSCDGFTRNHDGNCPENPPYNKIRIPWEFAYEAWVHVACGNLGVANYGWLQSGQIHGGWFDLVPILFTTECARRNVFLEQKRLTELHNQSKAGAALVANWKSAVPHRFLQTRGY